MRKLLLLSAMAICTAGAAAQDEVEFLGERDQIGLRRTVVGAGGAHAHYVDATGAGSE